MDYIVILIDNINANYNYDYQKLYNCTVEKFKNISNKIFFISNRNGISNDNAQQISFNTSYDFLDYFYNNFPNQKLIITSAFSPLIDIENTRKMIDEHITNYFDYTYPENIPDGLLPEIINTDIFCFIKSSIPQNLPLFKNSIKELFESDISSYDSNIFITESELIKYRINFIPDNYNNYLFIIDLIDNYGINLSIKDIEDIIKKNPKIIRKRPTYFEIELTTERENCEFFICNRLNREGEMLISDLINILEQINNFSVNPIISFGLYGEPFLYSKFDEVIEIIKKYNNLKFIFESRCIFNKTNLIEKVLELDNVFIIFDISFADYLLFNKYKKPLNNLIIPLEYNALVEFIKNIIKSFTKKVYVQFTRTTVNEKELMKFYNIWKDFSNNIIIKKPDIFGGILENYRIVDLSPIKRFPCLHLKHDFVIHFNGNVPICREDYNCNNHIGNIIKDGIENCWNKMLDYYNSHINENYKCTDICEKCDEWWVFNF